MDRYQFQLGGGDDGEVDADAEGGGSASVGEG